MLDKLKFNNLIISNKKPIQQARIQTINKLVQKIRKLKGLLEKQPDHDKNKERLRKTTENMLELKKLKRVEIMQRLLLLDKKPTSIVTNGRATPSEIAIAMLALNKILQTLVKSFKDELKLTTATDESWKEEIMEVSKRRNKINRTEEKRRQRKEQKEQKAIARKRVEWMDENIGKAEADSKEEDAEDVAVVEKTQPVAGVWQVEPLETAIVEELQENDKKNPVERKQIKKNIKKPETKTKSKSNKNLDKKTRTRMDKAENHDKTKSTLNEDITEPAVEIEMDAASYKSDGNAEPDATYIVDPFFITATGEHYLSTAIIERDNQESNENVEERAHMGGGYRKEWDEQRKMQNETRRRGFVGSNLENDRRDGNSFQNNNRRNGGNYQHDNQRQRNNSSFQTQKPDRSARQQERHAPPMKRQRNEQTDKNAAEQRLHPSWAAKQKLKPVISSFQGKKITFDDDSQANLKSKSRAQSEQHVKINKNANTRTNGGAATPIVAEEKLHPSWVAKQKLKPSITAFAGKKTTFDD